MSKVSLHIEDADLEELWALLAQAQFKTLKVYQITSKDKIVRMAQSCGIAKHNGVIVYRKYFEDGDWKALTPRMLFYQLIAEIRDKGLDDLDYLVYEGWNEAVMDSFRDDQGIRRPTQQGIQDCRQFAEYQEEWMGLMNAQGLKVALFSWSTHNPLIEYAPYFKNVAQKAAQRGNFGAGHEYVRGVTDRIGYFIDFYNALGVDIRWLLTEMGFDLGGDKILSGPFNTQNGIGEDGAEQLYNHFDDVMMQHPWVVGGHVFNLGGSWISFDQRRMLPRFPRIAARNGGPTWVPAVAPPPPISPPSPPAGSPNIVVLPSSLLPLIKKHEGLRLTPYDDVGFKAIGYGHHMKPNENWTSITAQFAEDLLAQEVLQYVTWTHNLVKVKLTENQWAALIDFCYNAGPGSLKKSELLKAVNAGDFARALQVWPTQNIIPRGKTKPSPALIRRREEEANLFKSDLPGGIVSVIPNGAEGVEGLPELYIRRVPAIGTYFRIKRITRDADTGWSGFLIHVFDEQGNPVTGVKARVFWPQERPNGSFDDQAFQMVERKDLDGTGKNLVPTAQFPLDPASGEPDGLGHGPYNAQLVDVSSDTMFGGMTRGHRHFVYNIEYTKITAGGLPPNGLPAYAELQKKIEEQEGTINALTDRLAKVRDVACQ